MLVLKYTKLHKSHMLSLLKARDMDEKLLSDIPENGLIAFENSIPVAAGFLRKMEGPYAIFDSYITNPNSSSELRNKALDIITRKLIEWAKFEKYTKLFVFTTDKGLQLRTFENYAFSSVPDMKFFCLAI